MSKKRAQKGLEMFDESTTLKRSDSMRRRTIITASEMDEEMYFLCSTMDENTMGKQESILSTAESHLTKRLKHVTGRELRSTRPKANSSPRVIKTADCNQSMTFNVDYASTPKKNQPRASTPSRMRVTTTIVRSLQPQKKTIPPPLLSSSMRPSTSTKNKRKRCVECCCTNEGVKRTVKKPRHNSLHSNLAKYPVRFMLDRRTQDIDRCNPVDDALNSCDLRPFLKNCYAFGDYNVWIL